MSVSDPRIGSQIGEYHVDDLLGEGGMGKVYTATGPDGTRVALKLVTGDFARDETFRRRFSRENRRARGASIYAAAVHRTPLARPARQGARSARRAHHEPDQLRRGVRSGG